MPHLTTHNPLVEGSVGQDSFPEFSRLEGVEVLIHFGVTALIVDE